MQPIMTYFHRKMQIFITNTKATLLTTRAKTEIAQKAQVRQYRSYLLTL